MRKGFWENRPFHLTHHAVNRLDHVNKYVMAAHYTSLQNVTLAY